MFAVIYRFHLKPDQESNYIEYWNTVASYFIEKRGAIGSCLHKGDNNLWVAYSRWPNKETRDNSWPGDDAPNNELPIDVRAAIQQMQAIKEENSHFEQYYEICMDIVKDML